MKTNQLGFPVAKRPGQPKRWSLGAPRHPECDDDDDDDDDDDNDDDIVPVSRDTFCFFAP